MKKILFLTSIILILPLVTACGIDDHGSVTGAAIAEGGECGMATSGIWGSGMWGFGMMGANYLGLIIFLYFVIGLGYVIYKLNYIENKLGRKK